MNRTERFYLIDKMLAERMVVTRQELIDEISKSWAIRNPLVHVPLSLTDTYQL